MTKAEETVRAVTVLGAMTAPVVEAVVTRTPLETGTAVTVTLIGSLVAVLYRMIRAREQGQEYGLYQALFVVLSGTLFGYFAAALTLVAASLWIPSLAEIKEPGLAVYAVGGFSWPWFLERWAGVLSRKDPDQ